MSEVWFVVHRYDLLNVSNRIIGFWDKRANYDRISIDDKIIYYRAGPKVTDQPGEIIGTFKTLGKGEDLCPDFSKRYIKKQQFLKWQCGIELEKGIKMPKKDIDNLKNRLSFYDNWKRHLYGGGGKQVFPATQDDIALILR